MVGVNGRSCGEAAPGMPALSPNSIPGLQSTIVNALTGIMREHIVFPKSVNVVVASDHTPQTVRAIEDALEVTPVGKLYVTVKGAKKRGCPLIFGPSVHSLVHSFWSIGPFVRSIDSYTRVLFNSRSRLD